MRLSLCLVLPGLLCAPLFSSAQRSFSSDTARVHALLAASVEASPDSVFPILDEAFNLAQRSAYRAGLAKVLIYQGIEKEEVSAFPEAVQRYQQALDLYGTLQDSLGIAKAYVNLGAAFFRMDETDRATAFWEKSLPLLRRHGKPAQVALILNNLIAAYSLHPVQARQALDYAAEALPLTVELEDTANQIKILINRGVAWGKLGRLAESQADYAQASLLSLQYGDTLFYCRCEINRAANFNLLGQKRTAYDLLLQLPDACRELPVLQTKLFFSELAIAAAGAGEFKVAYEAAQQSKILNDSLFSAERVAKITAITEQYESARKDLDLARQQQRLQRQRWGLWTAGAGGLLALALALSIFRGKRRAESLLGNILPAETIHELRRTGFVQARRFESVSVLFTDFKDFTQLAEQASPEEVVADLDLCFRAFDRIIERYPIEKIKTIGDAYMCAAGLPTPDPGHALALVAAAREMQAFMQEFNDDRRDEGKSALGMRIGIHSGPVVAGVVGQRKFAYDIWGDTVNTAARLESAGETGEVNISASTWALVQDAFECIPRGELATKNKAPMAMYFVRGVKQTKSVF